MKLQAGARWWWPSSRTTAALVALLLAAGFALMAHDAAERELFAADRAVHKVVQSWRGPELDGPMRAISALGSGAVLIPLNVLLAAVLWRLRYRRPLLVAGLTLASAAAEGVIKWLVHRPRPKDVGFGFPSGHVMGAIVFLGLIVYLLWRARRGHGVACLAAAVGVVIVAAIGVSRVYVNAHWPSDVAGGGAAGLAFVIFAALRLGPKLCARHATDHRPAFVARVAWLLSAGLAVLAIIYVGTEVLPPILSAHMRFELLCLLVALAAILARTWALRREASTVVVHATEAIVIVALASFPAHWLVLGAGVLLAGAYGYLRWRRPPLAERSYELVGALLMLALPLDILEDALQGAPLKMDAVWMLTAIAGLALITWARRRDYLSFRSSQGAA